MDLEEAVKTGSLHVPPQSFLRKTWLKRYCAIYNSSISGIQRIELFESEDAFVKQNPCKIIPLTDCIKVCPAPQKQQANVFEVRTKNNTYQFSADTFQDMSEWLTSLQTIAFGKKLPKTSSNLPNANDEKQEENLLYSSMEEPEIYPVTAVSTEATLRNKLNGNFKLIITPVNLSVAEESVQGRMGRIILTWPYRHIRRYGCTTENFSFEAGRKCVSGEGLFTFSTTDGKLIFQSVDAHVLALKCSQHEFDMPSSPSLNEDKNFFTSKDSLLSKTFSDKFDQTSNGVPGNEEVFQSKQLQKPPAPLSKPPRKKKSVTSTYSSPNIVHNKPNLEDNPKFSSNLYEELYTGKTFSSNSDLTSLSHMTCDDFEERNISLPVGQSLCYSAEKLQISDTPRRNSTSLASLDYENCEPLLQAKIAVSKPIDHVYGKILNAKQIVPKDSSNIYGSILPKRNSTSESSSSPTYSNVPFYPNSYNLSSDIQQEPDHFLQNDAEYAKVFKKNGKSFM